MWNKTKRLWGTYPGGCIEYTKVFAELNHFSTIRNFYVQNLREKSLKKKKKKHEIVKKYFSFS